MGGGGKNGGEGEKKEEEETNLFFKVIWQGFEIEYIFFFKLYQYGKVLKLNISFFWFSLFDIL